MVLVWGGAPYKVAATQRRYTPPFFALRHRLIVRILEYIAYDVFKNSLAQLEFEKLV